jgi:hypothetical protein
VFCQCLFQRQEVFFHRKHVAQYIYNYFILFYLLQVGVYFLTIANKCHVQNSYDILQLSLRKAITYLGYLQGFTF